MTDPTGRDTTAGLLRFWAREKPDHPALRCRDRQLTYAQLLERSCRVANGLREAGVGPGDRVAFIDKNSPEQVELMFGAALINAVPAPVNYRLAPPEIAVIVNDSEAKVFVVGEEFLPAVEKASPVLAGVRLLVIGDGGSRPSYAEWRDAHSADDPGTVPGPGDVGFQLYSSGTTGRPKGVQLTQANLAAARGPYPDLIDLGPDAVSLVAMPLYHIGGSGWLLAALAQGATNVIVREIIPPDLVELIEREGITHAFLVPAVLQFLLAVPGMAERDYSRLSYFMYGAAPISEKVLATSIRTFKCRFVQLYGLTETTGTVVYLPETDHDPEGPDRHRLRAIGMPLPGTEIRVVDLVAGGDVSGRDVGEIWVKGPTVMKGYWKMDDQTAETILPGGWLRTGDVGYHDADGYLYIHDRVKDMIVSGGENIYPAELENAIMAHPDVADVAVIGIPDDKWGETPKAVVVRLPGADLVEADVLVHCRQRLAGFKCPTSVDFVDELPRNPSGKVLKKDLRALYWEGKTRLVG
jgi:long-chain acyl-CoA synthetase